MRARLAAAGMATTAARTGSVRPRPPLRAIVFDMDGTLTVQGAIDFARMRARLGIPRGVDLIAHADDPAADAAERARRHAILVDEERAGLARMALQPHAGELFAHLHRRGLANRALLTRNNDDAMEQTVALLRAEVQLAAPAPGEGANELFTVMLSRSFTPAKPHPAPLLHLARVFGVQPAEMAMVGDSLDDVACAAAAGCVAVLITADDACPVFLEARPRAHHVVRSLRELAALVDTLLQPAAAAAAAAVAAGEGGGGGGGGSDGSGQRGSAAEALAT